MRITRPLVVASIAAILGGLVGSIGTAVVSSQATPPTCGADPEACLAEIQSILNAHAAATSTSTTTTEVPPSTSTSTSSSTTSSTVPATTSSISPTSSQPSTTTTQISTTSSTVPNSTSTSSTSSVPPSTTTTTVRPSIQPDATNTGWAPLFPPNTVLPSYGSCSVPAGATVDAKTFNCTSVTTGTNVTITRSRFITSSTGTNGGINPGSGTKISDSTLTCNRIGNSYGIYKGDNTTFTRMDISDCENAIEPGNNVTFQDSWVHSMRAQSGGHNDGVSIDGGHTNVNILHNTIDMRLSCSNDSCGYPTSSIMIDNWSGGGSLTGINVRDNWLNGGSFIIYWDTQFGSSSISGSLVGNQFGTSYVWGLCNRGPRVTINPQSGNTPDPSPC